MRIMTLELNKWNRGLLLVSLMLPFSVSVLAKQTSKKPINLDEGCVSISFDDGYPAVHHDAMPMLKKHGMVGTAYIVTGEVGKRGQMTWDEIQELQNEGWEIGAHSDTHVMFEEVPLSVAKKEARTSIVKLKRHGIRKLRSFAFPYGSYTPQVLAEVAKSIYYMRDYTEDESPLNPTDTLNPDLIHGQGSVKETSVEQIKKWIQNAKEKKDCIALVFHDLTAANTFTGSPHHVREPQDECAPDYGELYELPKFEQILQAIDQSGLPVVTDSQLAQLQGRLLLGPSIRGKHSAWKMTGGAKLDLKEHGSFPNARDSVVMDDRFGKIDEQTVRSKIIQVEDSPLLVKQTKDQRFIIEAYINTTEGKQGEMVMDADEFDQDQKLINTIRLGEAENNNAETLREAYYPSNDRVKSFQIRIHPLNFQGKAYVDNPTVNVKEIGENSRKMGGNTKVLSIF